MLAIPDDKSAYAPVKAFDVRMECLAKSIAILGDKASDANAVTKLARAFYAFVASGETAKKDNTK